MLRLILFCNLLLSLLVKTITTQWDFGLFEIPEDNLPVRQAVGPKSVSKL